MAISLKCVCGARLDIDDSFQGKKIPCPDCNRLLDTNAPVGPPRRTSGWALAALILPLAGMLTFILPVAGIVCGILGLRQIQRDLHRSAAGTSPGPASRSAARSRSSACSP